MKNSKYSNVKVYWKYFIWFCVITVLIYSICTISKRSRTQRYFTENENKEKYINLWFVFHRINVNNLLEGQLRYMVKNILDLTSSSIHLHVIVDENSSPIAKDILDNEIKNRTTDVIYTLFNAHDYINVTKEIYDTMKDFFSVGGIYYDDPLFYTSLALYKIAAENEKYAIKIDCDFKFKKDIAILNNEFKKFKNTNLFGLSPELSPGLRNVATSYRDKNPETSFGEYVHDQPITSQGNHQHGYPGYNEGLVLLDLAAIRKSKIFPELIKRETLEKLAIKYEYSDNLNAQDFFTIIGYEYPELFHTLSCAYNRQVCKYWENMYKDVFDNYYKCEEDVVAYHGNCRSQYRDL